MKISPEQPDSDLPERLQADLCELVDPCATFSIPAQLDHRILFTAKANFARRHRIRLLLRWGGGVAASVAAAAAIFVAIQFNLPQTSQVATTKSAGDTPARARALAGDINGDGVVDILDAMALARRLESNAKSNPAFDINKDGTVDQRDVDAIAQKSVSLGAALQ